MDLSQQTYVQCINCHSNIFQPPQNHLQQISGPICQHCLFFQSKLINQDNQQLAVLQSQLLTIKNHATNVHANSKESSKISQYNQKQIEVLEKQLKRLIDLENNLDKNQKQFETQFNILCQNFRQAEQNLEANLQQYGNKVCQLNALHEHQAEVLFQIRQLRSKRQNLLGYSVLMQIYHIHFDDQHAFINGEAITIDNLDSLLQILSYLIKKYEYNTCQISSTQKEIIWDKENSLLLQKNKPSVVKKWIEMIVKQTLGLWQHIKQVCWLTTKQNYDCYVLPFKIVVEPQLSINGKLLTPHKVYASFLKYFTHNIKYIISFDFDVELRSIGKWQDGKSYVLQNMDD